MKKFLNRPEDFVDEMLEGIYFAHSADLGYVGDDLRCMVSNKPREGKVGIVTGGGSGHLPLFLGYVGEGMLDGCAVGGVFQSPSSEQIYQIIKAIDQGAGVLCLYGNYTGDIMNFDMACEMAQLDGIETRTVLGNDDVASAPREKSEIRRGVAGIFFAYKAAGAAAAAGASLAEVERCAVKAKNSIATMGVALSPCIVPEVGSASFSLSDDEMEIGMGIHGEPGIRRGKLTAADAVVDEMLSPIIKDLMLKTGDSVAILVNGLGATPQEELYVLCRRVGQQLEALGVDVFKVYVGEFATSMEMAGASISLCRVDDELKGYLAAPANTPFFRQF
jgi:dihydroxyacetone kinase-like protein